MCGIIGVWDSPVAAREAFLSLTTLQHRGQDAAGILTLDEDGFHQVRNLGLVEAVFNRENMGFLQGRAALGHTRYSTAGYGQMNELQPFLLNYPYGIALVHNGNLTNLTSLRGLLKNKYQRTLLSRSDSEAIINVFAHALDEARKATRDGANAELFSTIVHAVTQVMSTCTGSYSCIALIAEHGLVAFRDPSGIRPLVWGTRMEQGKTLHMVASESVALEFNGYQVQRDLQPGEVLFVGEDGEAHTKSCAPEASVKHRPCMFEWIYFASPESRLDEIPVYAARIELGKHLARSVREQLATKGLVPDVVVPVPETARIAAIALAEELKIPYREVLIKNRYIKRTFIMETQGERQNAVSLKLSPVRSEIEGKCVLLVDDSIVRGTTSKKIVELVRNAGARHVIFVSTCPPIRYPCRYGLDFPEEDELIAHGRTTEQIEHDLGADAVVYQAEDGLRSALQSTLKITREHKGIAPLGRGDDTVRPCMACINGDYPVIGENSTELKATRKKERKQS